MASNHCPDGFLCFARFDASAESTQAAYCALKRAEYCSKLCPNADLVGIGVRIAFYLQSLMNAILVIKSPQDSQQGIWSATVLTGALIIPAMIQKFNEQLSLHHATMVLNFATLSTVTSLAVAPFSPVWRVHLSDKGNGEHSTVRALQPGIKPCKKRQQAKTKAVLAVALLLQIVLQWFWAVLLFVHPRYAQPACSPTTKLVLFGSIHLAGNLNGLKFHIWALWLLFCISITLAFGINMVLASTDWSYPTPRNVSNIGPLTGAGRHQSLDDIVQRVDKKLKKLRTRYGLPSYIGSLQGSVNACAFGFVAGFLITTEVQLDSNEVFPGERDMWTFSQSTAMILAIAPAWTLVVSVVRQKATWPQYETSNLPLDMFPVLNVVSDEPSARQHFSLIEPMYHSFHNGPHARLSWPVISALHFGDRQRRLVESSIDRPAPVHH